MSPLDIAFSAWALFIADLGVDVEPLLQPPASTSQIMQLQASIGFELPEDFVDLYLISNGQLDPYWTDKTFTGTYAPLFGWYDFINLDKVAAEYQRNLGWYEEELPEVFEAEVRQGDPVAAVAWQPGWVAFAVSNAAYYAVDLSPIRGGTYGQVIEYGHDTTENAVVASSISEFLVQAAEMLDPNEPFRYEFEQPNPNDPHGRAFSTLFFDMDWRREPEQAVDPEIYHDPEMDAWNAANHAAVAEFLAWLQGKGFSSEERDAFESWAFGMYMPMSMQPGVLTPPMPGESDFSALQHKEMTSLMSLELALRQSTHYIVEDLPVTLEEAFTLLHQFRVDMGLWTQRQFDAADRVLQRPRPARVSGSDGSANYSMSTTSVESQADGSQLLCIETYSGSGVADTECIRFSPDDLK